VYAAACRAARVLLGVFYRRLEVDGLAHVPARGPLLLVANHHNALVDALLILATIPRRIVPIAKAPLFAHPVLGLLLRAVGTIPVARRQDAPPGGEPPNPARNAAMFDRARAALAGGVAVLIFPEGVSQPEPVLMPLRTGAARLLLGFAADPPAGAEAALPVLLPIGLVYEDPATFRGGEARVRVGPPIATGDLVELASAAPEAAVRALTARIAETLRELILEERDPETRALVRVAEGLAEQEGRLPRGDPAAQADWRQRALRALARDGEDDPEGRDTLRAALLRYAEDLAALGLAGSALEPAYPARAVARYVARESRALLLGLPAAALGMVAHAVPYRLTALAVSALRPPADVAATYKLTAGAVCYPLCWAAEGWLAWRLGGPWLLAAFCLALVPGGLIALTWQERLARVRQRALGFLHFLADRDRHGHLVARRRALVERLEALAGAPRSAAGGEPIRPGTEPA
jgi:1-acyl-sn-glycerol-3-phosphate acyltransferase